MHPILQRKLTEVQEARQAVRAKWGNAILVAVAAVVACGAALLLWKDSHYAGDQWSRILMGFGGLLLVGHIVVRIWSRRVRLDFTQIARTIEEQNPELRATLLTAVEQKPGVEGFGYMQMRVIEDAVRDAVRSQWADDVAGGDLRRASTVFAFSLLLFASAFIFLTFQHLKERRPIAKVETTKPKPKPEAHLDVEVTPGDAEVEKGSRLVVEAKFVKDVPADAALVVTDASGAERSRLPMRSTVDAKVFGGLVSNINDDGLYHVEFEGGRSKDFKISTFVHPELVRSDAKITPPDYAKQPVREVKNTFKVTALEGSHIGWTMKINKPVKDAELYADKDHIIPLKPDAKDATTLVADMVPDESRKYRLHLVDDHERANKQPPVFHITVQANQLPKIEVAFPKRDAKVSRLQELPLEARVWDDIRVEKAGAVIDLEGNQRDLTLPMSPAAKDKKFDVKTLMNLEPEKVQPRQLVSYYFWAEDKDAKGQTRRTMSDMFFAEVRPFEELFREVEPPPGEDSEGEKKAQTDELVKMQKDIVNANWRLIRTRGTGKDLQSLKSDVETVKSSQSINDDNAQQALEKIEDAEVKKHVQDAQAEMKKAVEQLTKVAEQQDEPALNGALGPEQRALRHLFLAQSAEHNVTKANPKSKSKGQKSPQDQEIEALELKQKDQRYEEEKAASEEKTAEQQENLAVLNRLKELARREEALAKKMKELEQQLANAKTEEEKEELNNQLQRLKDEQEQLLRDLDDLRDRMEQPQNASNMADAKQQLDQTREKVNDALEQMKEQKLSQAQASATRAQKDLEQARDDFRQRTAKRFSEEMKAMRDQARDLAEQQQKLDDALENQKKPEPGKDAFDSSASLKQQLNAAQASRQIEEQRERAQKLMEEMKRVSEQAESTEPLLHKHLYDAVREAHVQGLEEHLSQASQQARYGDRNAAQDSERQAAKAVESLKQGVEKAAESVLGNESESLRMARNELDKLINEAREGEKDADKEATTDASAKGKPGEGKPSDDKGQQAKAGEGKDAKQPQDGKGDGKAPAKDGKADAKGKDVAQNDAKKGDGQKPGDGEKPDAQGKGEKPGQGKGGQQANDQATAANDNASDQQAKGDGKGKQPGQGKGSPQDSKTAQASKGQAQQQGGGKQTAANNRGGDGGWFFDEAADAPDRSPITGDRFEGWTDRLRNVEEMLTRPEFRNEVAKVVDNARAFRTDAKRNNGTPQPGALGTRIVKPLVELRDQVSEELARREGKNPLSPVDRDPVPESYRELVQKYYEQLGAGK